MKYQIKAEVDEHLSVDPSYIVRYQIFHDEHFMGGGVVQYHREAELNDIPLSGLPNEEALNDEEKEYIRSQIAFTAISYINAHRPQSDSM